ncbi:MAG: 50S ribosomal protein L9 [Capsulimonadales bacterium]|nr:50S ribosomal protein L9 [Capsulimonadales bacterium]
MKVILQQDIAKVGKEGEVVTVADGYARNYLFPRSLAVAAIGSALKAHQARKAAEDRKAEQLKSDAEKAAAELTDKTVKVPVRAGDEGRLYGSVTAQDIADAIKTDLNVAVDKRKIVLIDPIKSLGQYSIPVKLFRDIAATVTVEVVRAQA